MRHLFLLCQLLLSLALYAQDVDAYSGQVNAVELLIKNQRFDVARTQAEALVASGEEAQLESLVARGSYLLGLAILEDPASPATQRVRGIRALQEAARAFKASGEEELVNSIVERLQRVTGSSSIEEQALPSERLATPDSVSSPTEINSATLKAIVAVQDARIDSLTGSQVRQLLELERQSRRLDDYAFRSLNDSLLLLQQERQLDQRAAEIARERQRRNLLLVLAGAFVLILISLYSRYRSSQRYRSRLEKQNEIINQERRRSDELLRNILPAAVAEELKEKGKATARRFESVAVLFADFRGFSRLAGSLEPGELVNLLDEAFRAFDEIVVRHGLEKIKTIGDAYMCVSGLPTASEDYGERAVKAALDMQAYLATNPNFEARIGIHAGPVVAGVVGQEKFAYDVWGDTVNQAARLESAGEVGKVAISASVCVLLGPAFTCHPAGTFRAKNIGEMDRYFVSLTAE
jgi:class 3 adenylate cyclase